MNKRSLPLCMLAVSMWLIASLPLVFATTPTTIPNKNTIYIDSIGMPETVDPGWLYDTASATIVMNVYDTLTFFDWEDTAAFVPSVAKDTGTYVTPSIDSGFHHSIIFEIKTGITFSDGSALTPSDVEYSFERWLALDRSGGPTWMIYEALFGPGTYGASTSWPNSTSNPINLHVNSNSTHVWFNFNTAYSTTIFMQVISQSWAGILDKDWAVAHGAWDGNWAHWLDYYDPPVSPFDDYPSGTGGHVMMGSGPYKLKSIDFVAETYELEYYAGYWGGWPAEGTSGYVTNVVETTINEWSARKLRFLSDDPAAQADLTYVPRANTPEMEPEVAAGRVRYIKDLPVLALSPALFFNFDIPIEGNLYVGNGNFSEAGIPWDFFQDENVRYGFAYAFNYDLFISDVFLDEASQPATPLIEGVGFDALYAEENTALKYTYDLTTAETYLKAAWAGRAAEVGTGTGLWNVGFTMTITYNSGNVARQTAANMIKSTMEGMNSKFHVTVTEVDWPTYLRDLVNPPIYKAKMPIFLIGWLADYPDPHNFFFPFYHTNGDFTFFQSWWEAAPDDYTIDTSTGTETAGADGVADCDQRIEYALVASPHSARKEAYRKLMGTWHDDLPTVPLIQGLGRHYERTWVQGWYYNPIYPGNYYRNLWKGLDGDITGDGTVNILDAGQISAHWYPGPPVGTLGYDRKADIAAILQYPYDGKVNILDASIVNAYWGDTET